MYITMPELNTSQKIITFATTFAVTYLLLDLSIKVFRETFKILDEAFLTIVPEKKRKSLPITAEKKRKQEQEKLQEKY